MTLKASVLAAESYVGKEWDLYVVCDPGVFILRTVFDEFSPAACGKVAFKLGSAYQKEVFL